MSILGFGKETPMQKAEKISRYLYEIERLGKKGVNITHKTFNKKCNDKTCFAHAIIGNKSNTEREFSSTGSIQIKGSKCNATHFENIDKFYEELKTFLEQLENIVNN